MKTIYTIETNTLMPKRNAAIKITKSLERLRKAVAIIKAVSKKDKIETYDNMVIVQDLKKERQRMLHTYSQRYLVRIVNGRKVRIEWEENLKRTLDAMRWQVKYIRHDRKASLDYLASRPIGYYLQRYQAQMFKKLKYPTSEKQFTGIEIECITPNNVNFAPLAPFAKWISIGTDGSISVDNNDGGDEEGVEIRVCIENSELRGVLPKLLDTLKGMGARVNKSCGLHVHLDQRGNPSVVETFHKLVRSLGLLYTLVPKSRRSENQYCYKNNHADFGKARNESRYRAINASSYDKYNTLEVRLFGGTLEADKIVNWVEILWAIANGKDVLRCPKNFDTATAYWNFSDENIAWAKARQEKFAELNALAPANESDSEATQSSSDPLLQGSTLSNVFMDELNWITPRAGVRDYDSMYNARAPGATYFNTAMTNLNGSLSSQQISLGSSAPLLTGSIEVDC